MSFKDGMNTGAGAFFGWMLMRFLMGVVSLLIVIVLGYFVCNNFNQFQAREAAKKEKIRQEKAAERLARIQARGQNISHASAVSYSKQCNIRSGPGTSHDIVSKIEVGKTYEVLEQRGQWRRIMYNDALELRGWIGCRPR